MTTLFDLLRTLDVAVSNEAAAQPCAPYWLRRAEAVARPDSPQQVAAVIAALEAEGAAVVPFGGATELSAGYPPAENRPFAALSTVRLNRILDYQPDDLTITVEAGATIETVQKALAA
ncbi:MAG TPA: FAD-binding protein, partial [Chthonomonadales bacterium]|nr:FAD-binding protein [Chthonomonadales bacterium]